MGRLRYYQQPFLYMTKPKRRTDGHTQKDDQLLNPLQLLYFVEDLGIRLWSTDLR